MKRKWFTADAFARREQVTDVSTQSWGVHDQVMDQQ